MLTVPIFSESGEQIASEQIDPATLCGPVNPALLKQAVVMYHANRRQGHAVQRSRGEVAGSTRKLHRQKGTGRARVGSGRTCLRRGGGLAFAKHVRDFRLGMPRKMRRRARNQAVLAKIESQDALIVDGLSFEEPKTQRFAALLRAIQAERGCVFATVGKDEMLHKSGRNIQRAEIMDVAELNAYDVLSRPKLIFTREAFTRFKSSCVGDPADG